MLLQIFFTFQEIREKNIIIFFYFWNQVKPFSRIYFFSSLFSFSWWNKLTKFLPRKKKVSRQDYLGENFFFRNSRKDSRKNLLVGILDPLDCFRSRFQHFFHLVSNEENFSSLKKNMSCLIFLNMFVCLFHIVSLSVTLQLTSLVDRTCDLTWNTEDFQNKTPLWGIIIENLNCYCCFSSVEASLTTASTTTAHTATTTRTATADEARRSPAPSSNRTSASPTGHTETQLKNKSDDFITLYLSGDMTVWDSLM